MECLMVQMGILQLEHAMELVGVTDGVAVAIGPSVGLFDVIFVGLPVATRAFRWLICWCLSWSDCRMI